MSASDRAGRYRALVLWVGQPAVTVPCHLYWLLQSRLFVTSAHAHTAISAFFPASGHAPIACPAIFIGPACLIQFGHPSTASAALFIKPTCLVFIASGHSPSAGSAIFFAPTHLLQFGHPSTSSPAHLIRTAHSLAVSPAPHPPAATFGGAPSRDFA
jgi:hypothetical protein